MSEFVNNRDEANKAIQRYRSKHPGLVCERCGRDKDIEIHHIVPVRLNGSNEGDNLVPLCHICHCEIELENEIFDIDEDQENPETFQRKYRDFMKIPPAMIIRSLMKLPPEHDNSDMKGFRNVIEIVMELLELNKTMKMRLWEKKV